MPSDGVVQIPVPISHRDSDMAVTETVLEQGFVEMHKRSSHASQRLADTNDNVSEQTKLGFLEEKMKVGTREAAAMQRMDADKLAAQILQQRSASDQPTKTA